ncbi:glycine cleavage system protein GcvH [Nocardia beijingensis]
MSNIPPDLRYTKTDEWIRIESDGTITIGITDHAQSRIGVISYCELPEVGLTVSAGQSVCTLDAAEAAQDVYAPVSGEIISVNADATDAPEEINYDPYGAGLFRMKVADKAAMNTLLDAAAYAKHVG